VGLDAKRKQELGQFITPSDIGSFMASLFEAHSGEVQLLDAGAGNGALIIAFAKAMCGRKRRPTRICVTAYELDEAIVPALERTLHLCASECRRSGIDFSANIHRADFIEAAVALARRDLFDASNTPFNAAILNPPYRKIDSASRARRLLRETVRPLFVGRLGLSGFRSSKPVSTKYFTASSRIVSRVFGAYLTP
jgi:adenine-specific DNA-methyltransferase